MPRLDGIKAAPGPNTGQAIREQAQPSGQRKGNQTQAPVGTGETVRQEPDRADVRRKDRAAETRRSAQPTETQRRGPVPEDRGARGTERTAEALPNGKPGEFRENGQAGKRTPKTGSVLDFIA